MSIAEKLKALDASMRFDTPTDRATFAKGLDAEHNILRALPQIVALVEAAEAETGWAGTESYTGPRLRAALAALDEALGVSGASMLEPRKEQGPP